MLINNTRFVSKNPAGATFKSSRVAMERTERNLELLAKLGEIYAANELDALKGVHSCFGVIGGEAHDRGEWG